MANETKLANLIDPQVLADMIQYKMNDYIKFSPLFTIDSTLQGQPGSTLTLPKYGYIGDAEEFGEGEEISYGELTETSVDVKIKKAGRGVKLTDEAILSGYGDPVGEAARQIAQAIAQKIDNDCHASLIGIKENMTVGDGTGTLNTALIEKALAKFGEDVDEQKAILVSPLQVAGIRSDENFVPASEIKAEMMISGSLGQILGCDIILSNKVRVDDDGHITNFIVKPDAGRIFMKRGVMAESDRDIDHKLTKYNADEHYVTYLYDESKAVKIVSDASSFATLKDLTMTVVAGTAGKSKVNSVVPTLANGHTYKAKVAASATAVAYNDALTTGWTAVTVGETELSATAGQVITLAEVDASNKAKGVGTHTFAAGEIGA